MIAGTLEIEMMAKMARMVQDIDKAKNVLSSFERHAVAAIDTVKKAAASLGIGIGVGAFTHMVDGAIEAMASMHELAQKTGVTVETLSALQLVAKQSNTSMDEVAKVTQKLSMNMLAFARDGGGKAGDAFKNLGITQKQAADGLNNMSQFLPEFAKRLVDSSSGGRQVALAMELMSKGGANALPFLYQLAETQKLTAKYTAEQAAAADEYKDSLDALRDHSSKLGIALANELLPSLNKVTAAMLKGREEGEGFWGAMYRGLQTFLTGDDLHKANVEFVELTDKLMKLEKAKAAGSGIVWDPLRGVLDDIRGESKTFDAEIGRVKERLDFLQKWRKQLEDEAAKPEKPAPPQPAITDENVVKMAQQIAIARAKVATDAQRDMLTKQQQALDLFHKMGLVSEQDFFAQRQAAIDEGMNANLSAIQKQINAEAAVLNSGTAKDDAKRSARVKMIELEGQLAKVRRDAGADTLKLWGEEYQAQLALTKKENDLVDQRIAKQTEFAQVIMGMRRAFDDNAASIALETKYTEAEIAVLKTYGLSQQELTKRLQELTIAKETDLRVDQLRRQEREKIAALPSGLGDDEPGPEFAQQIEAIMAETKRQVDALPELLRSSLGAKGVLDQVRTFNDEARRIGNTLNDSITDGLLRGFENGNDFAGNFVKQLKAQFQSLILRPIIQFALAPVTGAVSTTLAGLTTSGNASAAGTPQGGLGGLTNLLSLGKSTYELMSGNSVLGSLLGLGSTGAGIGTAGAAALSSGISQGLLFGSLPSAGVGVGTAGGALFGSLSGASSAALGGSAIGGGAVSLEALSLLPTAAGSSVVIGGGAAAGGAAVGAAAATEGAAAAGLGSMAASAIPYIGWAIAIAGALGLFGGSKKIPARMIDSGGLGFTGTGEQFYSRGSQGAMDVASAISKGLQDAAKSLGATLPSYGIGYGSNTGGQSQNPNFSLSASIGTGTDYSNQRGVFAAGEGNGGYDKLEPELVALRSAQAMLAVLREADMPAYLKDFFDALKPVAQMSAEEVNNALAYAQQLKTAHDLLDQIAKIGGLKATADQLIEMFGNMQTAMPLLQSYFDNFFSESEKHAQALKQVNDAMAQLGISTIPATREEFRRLVEAQDVTTDAGKAMFQSLIAIAPAFAAVTDAITDAAVDQTSALTDLVSSWGDVAKSLRDYADELSGRTPGVSSYASLRSAFNATSMSARMGDIEAAKQLRDAGEAYRAAALDTASSSTDYARDVALIRSGVNGAISTADQQVSIAQRQLDELRNIKADLAEIKANTQSAALGTARVARQVERWDGDGMPAERVE